SESQGGPKQSVVLGRELPGAVNTKLGTASSIYKRLAAGEGQLGSGGPGHNWLYCASGAKVNVKTASVLTGPPSSVAGLYTHRRAASSAALRNVMCPLIAAASMMRPFSEMTILTSTFPEAYIRLAPAGYTGLAFVMATASTNTPELCCDRLR